MSPSASGKKPSKSERADWLTAESLRALKIIAGVAVGLVEVIFWIIYAARPNWGTYALVVGAPLVISFVAYRLKSGLASESVLIAINTAMVWIVFFTHPSPIAFMVGVVMLVLMLRNILEYARGTEREARLAAYRETEQPKRVNDRLTEQRIKDERYTIITRFHPIQVVVVTVVWAIIALACLAALVFGHASWQWMLSFFVVDSFIFGYMFYERRHEVFCLTDLRLFLMKGVFTNQYPLVDLKKITGYNMKVSALSKFLSWMRIIEAPYGTLILETASEKESIPEVGPLPHIYAIHKEAVTMMLQGDAPRE